MDYQGYDGGNNSGEIKTVVKRGPDNSITLVLAVALLSLVAAVVGALSMGALAYITKSQWWKEMMVGGLFMGTGAFLFAFLKGFYIIERMFNVDLNGDGYQGQPPADQPQEPEKEYVNEIYIERSFYTGDKQDIGHDYTPIPTPDKETLARMAVILAVNGPKYFTQDNFVTDKKNTKLMTRKFWDEEFFPSLQRARLAKYKTGDSGPVELTPVGVEVFLKLAGQAGTRQLPETKSEPTAPMPAYTLTVPSPAHRVVDASQGRKWRG